MCSGPAGQPPAGPESVFPSFGACLLLSCCGFLSLTEPASTDFESSCVRVAALVVVEFDWEAEGLPLRSSTVACSLPSAVSAFFGSGSGLLDGGEGGFELSRQELLGQRDEGTRQLSDRRTQARTGSGESDPERHHIVDPVDDELPQHGERQDVGDARRQLHLGHRRLKRRHA